MSDVIGELRRKEQQIQELRTRESRRQGQEDTLRKQLHDEFSLDSVEAATQQLSSISGEINQTEQSLAALNTELEGIIQAAIGGTNGSAQKA